MKRLEAILIQCSYLVVGLAFLVLIGAVLIQVLGRSGLFDSPVWTEELTRFSLLFMTAFGAGLSYHNGDLVNVDLLSEALPPRWRRRLGFIANVSIILLCLALIIPAWKFTRIGALQTSSALTWRMDFIHVSILILLLSLLFFAVLSFIRLIQHADDEGEVT